jgi:predicted permease
MGTLVQDLRYAVRLFARRRALTAVAVLSVAVATGPNAALFGLINGLFFQRLPVEHPDQLIGIAASKNTRGEALTYPDWLDIKQQSTSLAGVVAWERVPLPLSIDSRQEVLTGNFVSADYFTTLGVSPAIGRLFSPELDGHADADPPIVISYSYWQRRFAGAPGIVGTTALMAGRALHVVGVAPRGFRGLDVHYPVDGWMPFSAAESIGRLEHRVFTDRDRGRVERVIGRLRPGATIEQARADVVRIGGELAQAYPATNRGRAFRVYSFSQDRTARGLLAGAIVNGLVSLVLLVACANVAGLLLSLAEARRGEVAVRLSLGAGRWRLVRQFLTESAVLYLAGALLGLVLAAWLMRLPIAPPVGGVTLDYDVRFDTTVFFYAILLVFLTAVLFGLVPALQATKANLVTGLRSVRDRSRTWTRSTLVVGQIVVSQFLLAGAVLGVRSYMNLQQFRPGFDAHKTVLVATLTPSADAREPVAPGGRERLADRLRQLPGVVDVSAAGSVPLSGSGGGAMRSTAWSGQEEDVPVRSNAVSPKFFGVMGIRLLHGREFDARDTGRGSNAVIVNESLARRIAPGDSAIDRWIRVDGVPRQIIGIAEDGAYRALRDAPEPYLYLPSLTPGLVLIETSADPVALAEAVRRTVPQVIPELYVADVSTLGEIMHFARYADELSVILIGTLGALAMFLTAVGIYGTVSQSVTSRIHEFGIRMALGADRRHILSMVLGQGLRLTMIAVPLGVAAAVAGAVVNSDLLFAVSPRDPRSYVAGTVVVAAVSALACWGPARRASSVGPATALRHE